MGSGGPGPFRTPPSLYSRGEKREQERNRKTHERVTERMKSEIVDHDHTLTVLVLQMEGDISYFIEMQKRER